MKKIIALICAAALLCTLCVPAFAQNISDQLTEVMLAAKATLGIDDRYSDFTGSQDGWHRASKTHDQWYRDLSRNSESA